MPTTSTTRAALYTRVSTHQGEDAGLPLMRGRVSPVTSGDSRVRVSSTHPHASPRAYHAPTNPQPTSHFLKNLNALRSARLPSPWE